MEATSQTQSIDSVPTPDASRSWAYYVLAAYPLVFLGGVLGVFGIFTTTTDPSLFSAGIIAGYVFIALSVLAVFTYPAYRRDSALVGERGDWSPSFRRYLGVGIGVPLGGGLLIDISSLGFGGGLAVPGMMAVFVAVILHPVAVFFTTLGYHIRRRRQVG